MSTVQVPTMPANNFATVPLSTVSTTYLTQPLPTTTTIYPAATTTTSMQPIATQPLTNTVPFVPIVSHDGGPVAEVELKKRLLDGQRELKEKQAEMEADKEKKLEEKADKHRTKAVKWIGRGFPNMGTRHESKATALDVKANEHFMAAESLRLQAKAIDKERKSYDPPKEERKKPAAKNAAIKKPVDAAPRATTPVAKPAPQQRPVQTRAPTAATPVPVAGAAPSLQKEAVPVAPVVQREVRTETAAPSLQKEAAPVKEIKTEKVAEKPLAEEAPVVEETKTEKTTEENADGEKVVEKKEEKHHHLLHKNSGTPAH